MLSLASLVLGITFKTTLKGAGRLLDSVLGDLWMPGSCFILSAISLGYGIKELVCIPVALHILPWTSCCTPDCFCLCCYSPFETAAADAFAARMLAR